MRQALANNELPLCSVLPTQNIPGFFADFTDYGSPDRKLFRCACAINDSLPQTGFKDCDPEAAKSLLQKADTQPWLPNKGQGTKRQKHTDRTMFVQPGTMIQSVLFLLTKVTMGRMSLGGHFVVFLFVKRK